MEQYKKENQEQELSGSYRKYMASQYLASEDFEENEEVTLKIINVAREEVASPVKGNDKTPTTSAKLVVYFSTAKGVPLERPMVLNSTNAKAIAAIAKSPKVEKWVNIKVCLYRTQVFAFGSMQSALRIKPPKAATTNTSRGMPPPVDKLDGFEYFESK